MLAAVSGRESMRTPLKVTGTTGVCSSTSATFVFTDEMMAEMLLLLGADVERHTLLKWPFFEHLEQIWLLAGHFSRCPFFACHPGPPHHGHLAVLSVEGGAFGLLSSCSVILRR